MRPWLLAAFIFACSRVCAADRSLEIGIGLDYTPVALLRYDNNNSADFDIVDNTAWQGRISYNFANGFKSGVLIDYMGKTIHPGPNTTTDLTIWGAGIYSNYGYEITETGHALLVAGMETGYGELRDESNRIAKTGGALRVAGMVGTRFLIGGKAWLDLVYKLGWQEFSIAHYPSRKYRFAGSSLRVSLDVPLLKFSDKREGK